MRWVQEMIPVMRLQKKPRKIFYIIITNRFFVGNEFVNGLKLFLNKPVERVHPENGIYNLGKKNSQCMLLMNRRDLVFKDLLSIG